MSDAPSPRLFTLVLGHTRPWALRCVLEGLSREGALAHTEVWLDGHSERPELMSRVQACRALANDYPACRFVAYETAVGHARRLLDALADVIERHERILVLEDDCFPAPGALAVMDAALARIEDDPGFFSVYGDPLQLPEEEEGTYIFRPWGWATTRKKLEAPLARLRELWQMSEPHFLSWVRDAIADHPPDRPYMAPGQVPKLARMDRFQWDLLLSLLLSKQGIQNLVTPERVLWNFGIGHDSWHLLGSSTRYFEPPFNMITPAELCRRFDLDIPELTARYDIDLERTYRFVQSSQDARLLDAGWGGSEAWGTWAVNPEARLLFKPPTKRRPRRMTLELLTRAEVAGPDQPVRVRVRLNGKPRASWTYRRSRMHERRRVTVPAALLGGDAPVEVAFEIEGAVSPAARGLSDDPRELGFGISELSLRDS